MSTTRQTRRRAERLKRRHGPVGDVVRVTTERTTYLAATRGPVPMPNDEAQAEAVIEGLLDIGHQVAAAKGETLVRVAAPSTEALVEWMPE